MVDEIQNGIEVPSPEQHGNSVARPVCDLFCCRFIGTHPVLAEGLEDGQELLPAGAIERSLSERYLHLANRDPTIPALCRRVSYA